MPKPYPQEFRDDVVAVARQGQAQENEVLRRAAAYLSQANLPGKNAKTTSPAINRTRKKVCTLEPRRFTVSLSHAVVAAARVETDDRRTPVTPAPKPSLRRFAGLTAFPLG